jgi:hypothetical protein
VTTNTMEDLFAGIEGIFAARRLRINLLMIEGDLQIIVNMIQKSAQMKGSWKENTKIANWCLKSSLEEIT